MHEPLYLWFLAAVFLLGFPRVRTWWLEWRARRLADQAWAAWTTYDAACSFCRMQKSARSTGEDEHERVNLAFSAGILTGYSVCHRGRLDLVLCPFHSKDSIALTAKIESLFKVSSREAAQ